MINGIPRVETHWNVYQNVFLLREY